MRVIAGTYRSRILKSLKGLALRPTSDRLRETLFNVLGPAVAGARFLDVFAGTGAVGIEALSRGAAKVVFIEKHPPAAALIRKNLDSRGTAVFQNTKTGEGAGATVLCADALRGLEKLAAQHAPDSPPFDFVFIDPPYAATGEYARVLHFLGAAPFLAQGSVVIAEHHKKFDLSARAGSLTRFRVLKQGDAALSFYRSAPAS
ncbi:MAG TPA: 16S rRNA (guanine(966)-N(2))-methyltransferase RsmD [Candidatus Limnocylindrales bacterium]|nr:16S rRNA (guanine(966)-N(2))-methyltransferase RsmD [Candidatus Limnocylindrales bacterium]